jgi:hypothetical protein
MPKDDTVRIVCRLSVGYPEMIHACGGLEGVPLVDAPDVETFVRAIPNARVAVSHNRLQAVLGALAPTRLTPPPGTGRAGSGRNGWKPPPPGKRVSRSGGISKRANFRQLTGEADHT